HGVTGVQTCALPIFGPKDERTRGQEHLSLLILAPDRAYAEYMNAKGHYAEYGDVTLLQNESGVRHGTITTPDLQVQAMCAPTGELKTRAPIFQTVYAP